MDQWLQKKKFKKGADKKYKFGGFLGMFKKSEFPMHRVVKDKEQEVAEAMVYLGLDKKVIDSKKRTPFDVGKKYKVNNELLAAVNPSAV